MIGPKHRKIYILGGKRTPFGKFGGSLQSVTPVELAVYATKALLADLRFNPEDIDQVIFSNVIPSTPDTLYGGRHVALKCGLRTTTPAMNLNRLCGSGIESILQASRLIRHHEAEVMLVTGAENMSMAPHLTYGARFGTKYGQLSSKDLLLDTLYDKHAALPMGITAENLASDYEISKEDSDMFAFDSHVKANLAYSLGRIQGEIVPIDLEKVKCDKDEHLRSEIFLQEMKKLKPNFKKEGVVTAGSASGIVDGSASMLLASEDYVQKHKLKPIAEIIDGSVVGVDPAKMGIGPVPAIKNLLEKQRLTVREVGLFEINEAFAPQVLACQKSLEIPNDKLNAWGGAIALGHPLGATGIKITMTLARQLQHYNLEYGVSSACIGGGQGIAMLIRKI